ncbi:hypothetical protein [Sulfurovum sp.]|uniref:hypothetical protein n=1 Tax=Sulfurovum sp. TaxID=1969726 RepID=UPI0025E1C1EF|nr:hypothetical protein [Sulfurovum sp.]
MKEIEITLKPDTVDTLLTFSEILDKDASSMIEEALEQYFAAQQQKLMEQNINDENAMTNLNYDEFWDGLDVE